VTPGEVLNRRAAAGSVQAALAFQAPPTSDLVSERYDPASNTWSPAEPMSTSRYEHTATTLNDVRSTSLDIKRLRLKASAGGGPVLVASWR